MGINRTTATAVRHGPVTLGGMEIFNLHTEQGIQQTKMVLAHLRKNDEVGTMLQISMDHLQLPQAGVSWPVLSQPGHQQQKYIDQCYLSHLWDFLDSINSSIGLDSDRWLCLQRISDTFIMEDLAAIPDIKPTELKHAQ
jgi:hypothetical protein